MIICHIKNNVVVKSHLYKKHLLFPLKYIGIVNLPFQSHKVGCYDLSQERISGIHQKGLQAKDGLSICHS